MALEIFITLIIIVAAGFALYRSVKNKAKGTCNCGSCSKSCVYYNEEHKK